MAGVAVRSDEEAWPDHVMVLVMAADAWMNLFPWDCEYFFFVHRERPA